MHSKKDLIILNKAIDLVVKVYELAANLPKEEKYGLTSQIRRSAVSIPSNIAEGAGRNSNAEFIHFLSVANGSSFELEVQLTVSKRLGLISENELNKVLSDLMEIQKMNFRFQEHLAKNVKTKSSNHSK